MRSSNSTEILATKYTLDPSTKMAERSFNLATASTMSSVKGKARVADDSKTIFRFMDLPPELRNEIYRKLLQAYKDIKIKRVMHYLQQWYTPKRSHGLKQRWEYALKAATLDVGMSRPMQRHVGHVLSLDILRVNSIVHMEAASILYGANQFTFDNAMALAMFRNLAGQHFGLLKDISIRTLTDRNREALNNGLCYLKAPGKIVLGIDTHLSTVNRLAQFTLFLWPVIKPYVTNPSSWQQYKMIKRGSIQPASVADELMQKERFDKLHFTVTRGRDVALEDGTVIKVENPNDLHEAIRAALLEHWRRDKEFERRSIEEQKAERATRDAKNPNDIFS